MTEEVVQDLSRRVLVRKGLLLGAGAVAVGVAAPFLTGTGTARAYVSGTGTQFGWSFCRKCMGLFYGPWQSSSWCPAAGRHDGSISYVYFLDYGYTSENYGGQADWSFCRKCMGLFYGPWQSSSYCPYGGQHDGSVSYNYDTNIGGIGAGPNGDYCNGTTCWQNGWSFCQKCMGMFYGIWQSSSWCPAGGRHDGSSADYAVFYSIG